MARSSLLKLHRIDTLSNERLVRELNFPSKQWDSVLCGKFIAIAWVLEFPDLKTHMIEISPKVTPRASLHLGHAHKKMHFIHAASVARWRALTRTCLFHRVWSAREYLAVIALRTNNPCQGASEINVRIQATDALVLGAVISAYNAVRHSRGRLILRMER